MARSIGGGARTAEATPASTAQEIAGDGRVEAADAADVAGSVSSRHDDGARRATADVSARVRQGASGARARASARVRYGALGALAIAPLFASSALASPSARLVFARGQGAATCPDESFLRKAVAERLGYDPFFAWAPATVVVELARTDRGYRGRVEILDAHGLALGERVLDTRGDDCIEAIAALALAISIALDDLDALLGPSPPPPPPAAPPSPPAAPAAPSRKPDAPRPARPVAPSRDAIEIAAGATGTYGLAPAFAFTGTLSLEVRHDRWSWGIELAASLPSSAIEGNSRIEAHATNATLLGCVSVGLPFACATATLGAYEAHGDVAASASGVARYAGLGLRAGVDVPLASWLFVRGYAQATASLSPIHVDVDGAPAYTVFPVSVGAGAAVGLRIR